MNIDFVIKGFSILRLVAGFTGNSYLIVKLGMIRAMAIISLAAIGLFMAAYFINLG